MEGLQISFLLKASVLQSKTAFMVCFFPLLLVLLFAFPPLESTLLPAIWHALLGFLEEPTLAFLLLNCVTLTIIASSKLGSGKRGHEEEGQGQVAMKLTEKGDDIVETVIGLSFYLDAPVENGHQKLGDDVVESVVRPGLYLHTPFKTCPDFSKNKGGNCLKRCWSLSASFEYKTKHEHVKLNHVKENVKEKKIKPLRSRGRLGSRRSDKVGIHPNKPLSAELQKKQLARGSLTSSDAADSEGTHPNEKPALKDDNCDSIVDEECAKGCSERAGSATDQETQQAAGNPVPAAGDQTVHPSMDEVWAAIMSSKKSDDRMPASLQAKKRSEKPKSRTVKQPQPGATTSPAATQYCTTAALVAPPAAAAETPPAAAAAAAKSPKSAGKVPNSAKKATAAAAKKHGCTEVEELNHRADEFIERFNRQIRLQREDSLQQRQVKTRGRRACNNYDVQHSRKTHTPGLCVPARGLLVG